MSKETFHTQIIATLGPATRRLETLRKMAEAGMAVVRLNFSHGTHAQHRELIRLVRQVNAEFGFSVRILQDLAGYRIRVGHLRHPLELMKYQTLWMVKGETQEGDAVPLMFDDDLSLFQKGMDVYIDDGKIYLKVIRATSKRIQLQVFQGGRLHSKKGVNVPGLKLRRDILTEKDKADILFGLEEGVDFVAQSFVRNRRDIDRVNALVKPSRPECRVVAKIESQEGIRNLDGIIEACDAVLVARGDLGVSLPISQIPIFQKAIIRRCNQKKRYVITATQMLDSMTENARPTRAEVSDVANAIIDGTDYVMLSGETAVGSFPVKSVRMMREIIAFTEKAVSFSTKVRLR